MSAILVCLKLRGIVNPTDDDEFTPDSQRVRRLLRPGVGFKIEFL